MAQYSYDEPTNREDLTDVITNISPKETPITTMIGKTKAKATYHEFPEDELADAAENAHVEGEKDTAAAAPARTRVTNTQQAVDKAGVSDEYAYQMLKAMKELGKDLELAITTQTTDTAGSKTEARKFAGIPGLVTTNKIAAGANITMKAISDALQKAWEAIS